MPQIEEYTQQVATPEAFSSQTPNLDLVGAPGKAVERIGGAIEGAADKFYKRDYQESVTKGYEFFADKSAEVYSTVQQHIQEGTLNQDVQNKILDDYDKSTMDARGEISNAAGQRYFDRQTARYRGQILRHMTAGAAQVAAAQTKASLAKAMDTTSAQVLDDPSSFDHAMESSIETIDEMVKSGGLPAEYRDKAINEMGKKYSKSAIRGWAKLDPDKARDILKSGQMDQYMDGDEKQQMYGVIKEEERARDVDEERAERLKERAEKERDREFINNMAPKIADGSVSAKDLTAAEARGEISGETMHRLIGWVEHYQNEEDKPGNPRLFDQLLQRIKDPHAENAIVQTEDLMKYVGGKEGISIKQFNSLNGFLAKTPEAQARKLGEKRLFDEARRLIPFKNLRGYEDKRGQEKLNQFYADYQQRVQDMIAQKKDPSDLTNPSSPDYFGKHLNNYITPDREKAKLVHDDRIDKANGIKPTGSNPNPTPDPKARLPGESVSAWKKRTGI